MLDQVLKEAGRVYEVDIVKIAQENGLEIKNVRQFAECFKKAFPYSAERIDKKLEEDLYFTSSFEDIVITLLQDYVNVYDVIKIHSERKNVLIEVKDSVTENVDFNFEDERTETTLRTNHDRIVYQEDFDIISLHRSAKVPDDVDEWGYFHFLVVRGGLDFTKLRVIPQEAKLVTPITLNDCTVKGSIIVEGEDNRIFINGDCRICGCEGRSSVSMKSDMVIFKSDTPGSKLTIYKYPFQACIGTDTHAGMSYGRWSPAPHKEFAIHVTDDLTVNCLASDNFSIGCYGNSSNYVPIICIQEGSTLICPEMEGKRIIKKQALPPAGSTKISEFMQYAIIKEGQSITDLYTEEDKELIETLKKHGIEVPTEELIETKRLQRALKYRARGSELNFSKLFDKNTDLENAASSCCLKIPQYYSRDEFTWECSKVSYLNRTYYSTEEDEDALYVVHSLIKHGYEKMEATRYADADKEYLSEVLWSMIPPYNFVGNWRQPALDVVKDFLDVCGDYKELTQEMVQKFFDDYGF